MDEEKPEEKKSDLTGKLRKNPWILSTFVLFVLVIILLAGSLGSFSFTGNAISENEAGNILLEALQSQGVTDIAIDSVEDISGVYQVNFLYQGQVAPAFITKDGKFLVDLTPLENSGTGSVSSDIEVSIDDDAILGDMDAPVTMIEFSDYQCPFCRQFWAETYPLIKSQYIDTGKVRYVFRDFTPTLVNPTYHPNAVIAAMAAECVGEKGGDDAYFEYHDKIFENQVSLNEDNLKAWAKGMGYDISACLDSEKFLAEVENDLTDGQIAGVSGTPGFVIMTSDGSQKIPVYSGAQPYSVFEEIIEGELSAK